MGFTAKLLNARTEEWTGVDLSEDGRYYAARVDASGKGHCRVVKCARSSGVAVGDQALAELAGIGGTSWTLPLARGDYQMMIVPEPPVSDREMDASLRWTLGSVVDFPLEDAVLSWMRIPTEQHDPAREKQIYVIAARRAVVEEQAALFRSANLPLKAVDIRETALRNLAALLERNSEGVGFVTVGASGVTATFTYREELYLDRFMAQSLQDIVDADEARQQRFYARIVQQLAQSLELLSREYPFVKVGRIVVAPQLQLPDLLSNLQDKLPVPVEQLDLARVLDLDMVPELKDPQAQSHYLGAIGSALRGMKSGAAS
jgi:MSHA biogenesis protein MshI